MLQENPQEKADELLNFYKTQKKLSNEEVKQKALELSNYVKDDLYKIYMENIGGRFNHHFENRVAYWEDVVKNIKNS